MGGKEKIFVNGFLPVGKIHEYLTKNLGLSVRDSGNLVDLVRCLQAEGLAMVAYGGHAQVISGVETQGGEVYFRMHDPAMTTVEKVSIEKLAEALNRSTPLFSLFLIEKPG